MQQQHTQTPPGQPDPNQVPDHRFDELAKELRLLRDQNQQLRGQIDYMAQSRNTPQQQTPKESPFDPKVDEALNYKFKQLMEASIDPIKRQTTEQIGYLVDQNDDLKFQLKYGGEKFKKYHEQVERLRQDYQAKGQYIPREEALRIVYFEETGKKAQPAQAGTPQQVEPKYDPYLQTYVNPQTGQPVGTPDHTGFAPEPEQQTQTPQVPQWQQPNAQAPQMPQQTTPQVPPTGFEQHTHSQHPYQNPYGAPPQLPQQGVHNPAATNPAPMNQHLTVDLESSDAELEAFEKKYGDISL